MINLDRISQITKTIIKYSYGENEKKIFKIVYNTVEKAYFKKNKLNFIMPSFPGKSPNSKSCFSSLPDYGEKIAIQTIQNFLKSIEKIYPYGVTFTIIHDGHFFEPLGITRSEEELNKYIKKFRKMINKNISSITIYDLFETKNFQEAYKKFKEKYIIHENYEIDSEVLSKEIVFTKYEFESKILIDNITKNQFQKKAKKIAKESLIIKSALSELIRQKYKNSIRLSVHYQLADSNKMGLKLVPTASNKGTPWFYVIYKSANNRIILGKKNWNLKSKKIKRNLNGFYYSITNEDFELFIKNSLDKKVQKEKGFNR